MSTTYFISNADFIDNDSISSIDGKNKESIFELQKRNTNDYYLTIESGYDYTDNKEIIFIANKFIKSIDELWKLEFVFGKNQIETSLTKNENILDTGLINGLIKESKLSFYINKKRDILLSTNSSLMVKTFGELDEITLNDAILFGLDSVQEALEKNYTKIS